MVCPTINAVLFISLAVAVFAGYDPLPAKTDSCPFLTAHSCYLGTNERYGCVNWCKSVENLFKDQYGYQHGCRYGNYLNTHSYCRKGKSKAKCSSCKQKNRACCGTCMQDCGVNLVYKN